MTPCRLIVDPPQEGAWNMAVDEALLEDAADRGLASLRFYEWREPTLSLGYFQPYQDRFSHAPSAEAVVVRRLSGGGALLHDRELTYSLCLPAMHPLARRSSALYGVVHRALIDVLSRWRVPASIYADVADVAAATDEPFLCFARRTGVDVVVPSTFGGPAKIVGSAQRRRRGAVLQHGAVLLATSAAAPELPGVNDVSDAALTPRQLLGRWREAMATALELRLNPASIEGELRELAQRLQREKYAHRSWTERR
jgi:lipoyl(octanoyl) transferase